MHNMTSSKKFSSKMDEEVLNQLKALAKEQDRDISSLLEEAVNDLILKKRIRPAFEVAANEVFFEFNEALKELAK